MCYLDVMTGWYTLTDRQTDRHTRVSELKVKRNK